jgi:ABC-2 type transport system permease protein
MIGHGAKTINPVVYTISGFRWNFYETSGGSVGVSLGMTLAFLLTCLVVG